MRESGPRSPELPSPREYTNIAEKSLDAVVVVPVYNEAIHTVVGLLDSIATQENPPGKAFGICFVINNKPDAHRNVQEQNQRMIGFLRSIVAGEHVIVPTIPPELGDAKTVMDRIRNAQLKISVLDAASLDVAYANNNVGYARDIVTKNALKFAKSDDAIIIGTDADSWLHKKYVGSALEYFEKNPDIGAARARLVTPFYNLEPAEFEARVNARSLHSLDYLIGKTSSLVHALSGNKISEIKYPGNDSTAASVVLGGATTMMRVAAFKKTPGYPHIVAAEDVSMEMLLRTAGVNIGDCSESAEITVYTHGRFSDRTDANHSYGGTAQKYTTEKLFSRPVTTTPNEHTIREFLGIAELLWKQFQSEKTNPRREQNFRDQFVEIARKRFRLSDPAIQEMLNEIFDYSSLPKGRLNALQKLRENRYFAYAAAKAFDESGLNAPVAALLRQAKHVCHALDHQIRRVNNKRLRIHATSLSHLLKFGRDVAISMGVRERENRIDMITVAAHMWMHTSLAWFWERLHEVGTHRKFRPEYRRFFQDMIEYSVAREKLDIAVSIKNSTAPREKISLEGLITDLLREQMRHSRERLATYYTEDVRTLLKDLPPNSVNEFIERMKTERIEFKDGEGEKKTL